MLKAEELGTTLIVQAGAHGSDLGRLELTVERGKVTAYGCTLTLLDHDKVEADVAAERLLKRLLEPHLKAMDEVVGKAAGWLFRAQTLAGQEARKRDEESPIDSLFADIFCEQTGADVALLPGVGYGVAIPPGAITAAQLRQMVPHEPTRCHTSYRSKRKSVTSIRSNTRALVCNLSRRPTGRINFTTLRKPAAEFDFAIGDIRSYANSNRAKSDTTTSTATGEMPSGWTSSRNCTQLKKPNWRHAGRDSPPLKRCWQTEVLKSRSTEVDHETD